MIVVLDCLNRVTEEEFLFRTGKNVYLSQMGSEVIGSVLPKSKVGF